MNRWLQRVFSRKNRPVRPMTRRHAFRPQVEALEDRLVPSAVGAFAPAYQPFELPPLVVTVTSSGDLTSTGQVVAGSLRAAIDTINSDHLFRSGPDQIVFKNSGTVLLDSALPALTRSNVVINGTNESTGLSDELFGSFLSTPNDGLTIAGGNVTVENLDLLFCHNALTLSGGGADLVTHDVFGILGSTVANNTGYGAVVTSAGNTITDCNFAANTLGGIEITGAGATGNLVSANTIGTNSTGTKALDDQEYGVEITFYFTNNVPQVPTGNTIVGNVISGNSVAGVDVEGNINYVESNLIGTDATGTKLLGNGTGVVVGGATYLNVGEVGGNGDHIIDNTISGSTYAGVSIGPGSGNFVQGNMIGTDRTGEIAIPNGTYGVEITGSDQNTIGGTSAALRNVISASGTAYADVYLNSGASSNAIEGDYIGTDARGLKLLMPAGGPTEYGVEIVGAGARFNTIGGTAAGAGNVISGASFADVAINDQGQLPANVGTTVQETIQGNFIGTDETGTVKLGTRTGAGIFLLDTMNILIGGTAKGSGNVIAVYTDGTGVTVEGLSNQPKGPGNPAGNEVLDNYIGVALNGKTNLGDTATGIGILFSNSLGNTANCNTIGFCDVGIEGVTGNTHLNNTFVHDVEDTLP